MPDTVMTPVASSDSCSTLGSKAQITGRAKMPRNAVKTISTAVSLCRKYFSTRYLSMWVDRAHRIGPERAYSSHISRPVLCLLLGNQHIGNGRARRGAGIDHQGHRQMHRRAAGLRAAVMRHLARDQEAFAGLDRLHRQALQVTFKSAGRDLGHLH